MEQNIFNKENGKTKIMEGVQLIESSKALLEAVEVLRDYSYLGIDTESDGFYSYFEKICLIQISIPDRDIIVDLLPIDDLSPLREILETPRIEKILHASNNDLLALQRDYGFRVRNLFDTAVAWQMLGHKRCGLDYILQKELAVEHPMKSKYQRCNWAQRPLTLDKLEYARLDTHHLISLRHRLDNKLSLERLRKKAQKKFQQLEELIFEPKKPDPLAYLKIKNTRFLDSRGKDILRELYRFRDRLARKQDCTPFRIITNQSMLHLASKNPRNLMELRRIPGLPRHFKNQQAGALLGVISRAYRQWRDSANDPTSLNEE